jgi:hypothetical protein
LFSSLTASMIYLTQGLVAQMESIMMAVPVGVLLLLGLLHDDTGGTAGGVQ